MSHQLSDWGCAEAQNAVSINRRTFRQYWRLRVRQIARAAKRQRNRIEIEIRRRRNDLHDSEADQQSQTIGRLNLGGKLALVENPLAFFDIIERAIFGTHAAVEPAFDVRRGYLYFVAVGILAFHWLNHRSAPRLRAGMRLRLGLLCHDGFLSWSEMARLKPDDRIAEDMPLAFIVSKSIS